MNGILPDVCVTVVVVDTFYHFPTILTPCHLRGLFRIYFDWVRCPDENCSEWLELMCTGHLSFMSSSRFVSSNWGDLCIDSGQRISPSRSYHFLTHQLFLSYASCPLVISSFSALDKQLPQGCFCWRLTRFHIFGYCFYSINFKLILFFLYSW